MSKTKEVQIIVPSGTYAMKSPNVCSWNNVETDFTILQESTVLPGVVSLDAFIQDAPLKRFLGFEIDEERRDEFVRQMAKLARRTERWAGTRSATVVLVGQKPHPQPPAQEPPSIASVDWVHSTDLVLSKLVGLGVPKEDRRVAVLFAETLAFSHEQLTPLLDSLASYIEDHRFDLDDSNTTAVAAAIRKYAMNMSGERFDRFATWIQPNDTETLSKDVELELAKSVANRFTYEPVASGHYESLYVGLSSLAFDYLTPRLLLQENFASIATNASVGCGLIAARADNVALAVPLIERIHQLRVDWFSELVMRRLQMARDAIQSRDQQFADAVESVAAKLR